MNITKKCLMLNAIEQHTPLKAALRLGVLLGIGGLAVTQQAFAAPEPLRSPIVETIKAVQDSLGGDNTAAKPTTPPASAANAAPKVILKIHGASTLGNKFVPDLAKHLLEQRGHRAVETLKPAEEVVDIVGQGNGNGERETIEIISYGTSAAFGESQTFKHVGLEKKFADIGMGARRINPQEIAKLKAAGIGNMTSPAAEHVVALDGVVIYVSPANPIAGLSIDEVRRIYLHEVADWSEVHGVDANGNPVQGKPGPIAIYCAHCRVGDGTYDFMKQNVFSNTDIDLAATYVKRTETHPGTQQALANDPNGIGYGSTAFRSNLSKPLRLTRGGAFVDADDYSIKTGEYPLVRNLYLYTPEKKTPIVGQFVALALSSVGQGMLASSNLISPSATGNNQQTDYLRQADAVKQRLLANPQVPAAYKTLVRNADRAETPYNLRFESSTNQLENKSLIDLGRLVQTLNEPRNKNATVVLVGFSDSRGEPATNLKLSEIRAQFVADVLKTQGINQIEIAGFGEEPALLQNPVENSPEALKDNRRVEVWLKHAP